MRTLYTCSACACQWYILFTHVDGEEESLTDKLRSILAQMEFTYVVRSWDQQGVPFRTYLYVPEVHPNLGNVSHEREDEGHVYKVHVYMWHSYNKV